MLTSLNDVLRDDEGATLVEYSLVIALIAVACLTTLTTFGSNIKTLFSGLGTTLTGVSTSKPAT